VHAEAELRAAALGARSLHVPLIFAADLDLDLPRSVALVAAVPEDQAATDAQAPIGLLGDGKRLALCRRVEWLRSSTRALRGRRVLVSGITSVL
jgi:hypothetical protein